MSLQEVSDMFNEIGWKHQLEDEVIISMGGSATSNLAFFTRLGEDGEMFKMTAKLLDDERDMISAKGNAYVKELMAYLLLRNYETKFGTWEFDPSDGDIQFCVEIPLEDNKLTKKQLQRITRMLNSSGSEADAIKSILATGKLPLDGDDAANKIAELEALLAQLQGAGI